MDYEQFKEAILSGMQEIYGGKAVAWVKRIMRNNGCHYEGILTARRGEEKRACIAIPLEWFYRRYRSGDRSVESCVRMIYQINDEYRVLGNILFELKDKLRSAYIMEEGGTGE